MAHKCNTIDDGINWTSRVKGNSDGEISIENEQGSKNLFAGTHLKTNERLFGRCFDNGGAGFGGIWFAVPGNNHLYIGQFNQSGEIHGHRYDIDIDTGTVHLEEILRVNLDKSLAQADDWVGTKT